MAIAELYTGTETVSTTEWSLTTDTSGPDADTTDGIFQVFIDFNAVAAGDEFQIKIYEKTRAGDTQRVIYAASVANVQTSPIWVSPSLILLHGWDITLKKIAGTDRAINWSIRQVA
jgi:hypothetical protein